MSWGDQLPALSIACLRATGSRLPDVLPLRISEAAEYIDICRRSGGTRRREHLCLSSPMHPNTWPAEDPTPPHTYPSRPIFLRRYTFRTRGTINRFIISRIFFLCFFAVNVFLLWKVATLCSCTGSARGVVVREKSILRDISLFGVKIELRGRVVAVVVVVVCGQASFQIMRVLQRR